MTKCSKCGADLADGSKFCSACGASVNERKQWTFRRANMTEEVFIERINDWFAHNPCVGNVKADFTVKSGYGFLVNRSYLNALTIEYERFPAENENQYALVVLSHFGLYRKNATDILREWQKVNPGAIVLSTHGITNQRGTSGELMFNGLGAANKTQIYVFFKFHRKNGVSFSEK